MAEVEVIMGDSRDVLKTLGDCSIDSVVCDPPYALVSITKRFGKPGSKPAKGDVYQRAASGFMSQTWDTGETAFAVEFWAEVMRVLKPGGHVVAFSGTRTYHRLACAVEDAGFEIRDMLSWLYGSGFPKSHDVSKGIDKARDDKPDIHRVAAFVAAGRDAAGFTNRMIDEQFGFNGMAGHWTNSRGPQAQVPKWEQWLRLKSLCGFGDEMDAEVWRLNGRKGTPGDAWGDREFYDEPTGGLHGGSGNTVGAFTKGRQAKPGGATEAGRQWEGWGTALKPACEPIALARKPLAGTVAANILTHGTGALNIDGCRVEAEGVDLGRNNNARTEGTSYVVQREARRIDNSGDKGRWPANVLHDGSDEVVEAFPAELDGESAARYFYTAKADATDRLGSKHPTIKPTDLMRWLCRLVTPPKVVEWVCETCNNPPHDDSTLQDLPEAAEPSEAKGVLLSGMPSGRPDESSPSVQDVRGAGSQADTDVLLTDLPSGVGKGRGEDAASQALRAVRDGLQASEGRGQEVLREGVCVGSERSGQAEGPHQDDEGLLAGLSARSPNGVEAGLHHGASPRGGGSDWSAAKAKRGRPSPQRGQGRQSAGEPGADVQGSARPHVEDSEESAAPLPPLSGPVHAQQLCPNCKGRLTRTERPGIILDPFAGSGSTGVAAIAEGFDAILIEREDEYVADIHRRIAWAKGEGRLTAQEKAKKPDLGLEGLSLFGDAA